MPGLEPPRPRTHAPAAPPADRAVPWRIRAIIPCFGRAADLDLLLADLAALDLRPLEPPPDLHITVVDNASDPPLRPVIPPGLEVDVVRLERNTGGSGGFNAGLAAALAAPRRAPGRELLWLLDSDVRLVPDALAPLVKAMEEHPTLAAAGSGLHDPATGRLFELGGRINRRTGELEQPLPPGAVDPDVDLPALVPAEYLAACSLLVRREAAEAAGPLPDIFLNGDDAAWCLRLARITGQRLAAVPASRAVHPHPDRMRTWARYYAARNAFVPIEEAGLGAAIRWRRAWREVGRALSMAMVGRDDLAELHLRGLADAAAGRRAGPAPEPLRFEPFHPFEQLGAAVRDAVGEGPARIIVRAPIGELGERAATALRDAGFEVEASGALEASAVPALRRLLIGPPAEVAIASARARPADGLAGRLLVTIAPEGFVLRRIRRLDRAARAAGIIARGVALASRLAVCGPGGPAPWPAAPSVAGRPASGDSSPGPPSPRPTLSIVIVSHNRREAVDRTLRELANQTGAAGAEIIIADNASTDGTVQMLRERHPRVRIVEMGANRGVAAFNEGARRASGEAVLVLDDDAWPDPGALEAALDVLAARPDVAAVALHPRHARTDVSEWPFAERLAGPRDDWPVMGCGNLVRREAWQRVGGYEETFFLYRNDVDLAMKLLGAGWGVYFDPRWVVRHDSAAAARKSRRWFELATRNWVWLCRRHGRGLTRLAAIAAGWAWAHRLAGLEVAAHGRVLRGAFAGMVRRPPPSPVPLGGGPALRALWRLRLERGAGSSAPRHLPSAVCPGAPAGSSLSPSSSPPATSRRRSSS